MANTPVASHSVPKLRPNSALTADKQALVEFFKDQDIKPTDAVVVMLSLVADIVRPHPNPKQHVVIDIDEIVEWLQDYLMRRYRSMQQRAGSA
jgi:hypothetical protein